MDDASVPKTKEELISSIEAGWAALMETAGRLSDEQMVKPDEEGWSPKDNLAHIAEWLRILKGYHLQRQPGDKVANVPAEVAARWDADEINVFVLARNRDRSAQEVMGDLKSAYADLMTYLQGISFEDLMKPRHEGDPERRPVLNWVLADTVDHFEEHRLSIEKTM